MKGNRSDEVENRGRQLFTGAGILFVISLLVVTFLMGWRYVPGWVGESLGTLAGIMSTPFFMEASFFILGLVIVIGLNTWRRHRAGDEFVTIDTKGTPEAAKPDDAGHS